MPWPLQEGETERQSFFLDRALYAIAISVLDMGVMYFYGLGFNSQTLNDSI